MSEIQIDNVILFARAGFRGLAYSEDVMTSVAETMKGIDIKDSKSKKVGTVDTAEVVGSLIRGTVTISEAFLQTEDGKNFIRRTGAKFQTEPEAKPAKTAAKKPEVKKPEVKKPVVAAKTPAKPAQSPAPEGKKPVVLKSVKSVKKPAK